MPRVQIYSGCQNVQRANEDVRINACVSITSETRDWKHERGRLGAVGREALLGLTPTRQEGISVGSTPRHLWNWEKMNQGTTIDEPWCCAGPSFHNDCVTS